MAEESERAPIPAPPAQAAVEDADEAWRLYHEAFLLYTKDSVEDARATLERIVERFPDHPRRRRGHRGAHSDGRRG